MNQKISFDDGVLTVLLSGEIDHHTARRIREETDSLIQQRRPSLLRLDFSGVGFMDSSGIGLIMGRYALCKSRGIEFRLAGADERVVKILDMAGLCSVIKTEPAVKGSAK